MFPVENRGKGAALHFPDVCLTPPTPGVPVPYQNVAPTCLVVECAWNVLTAMVPTLNTPAVIARSTGDEAGALHWTKQGVAITLVGVPHVLLDFLPVSTLCNPSIGNNGNASSGGLLVPSVVNTIAGYAAPEAAPAPPAAGVDPYARAMTPADIDHLATLLDAGGRDGAPPVREAMLPGGVGWLEIRLFSADVPARVHGAVRRLRAEGMEALIIDLRGNPGGEVMAAIELAGDFLEPGSLVVTRRDEEGDETAYRARQERPYRFPVAALIDGGTASAAELFAGCLKAHGRAVLIGEPTRGKGVAQRLGPDASGACARLETVARFELPGGAPLHEVGIEPDVAWGAAERR